MRCESAGRWSWPAPRASPVSVFLQCSPSPVRAQELIPSHGAHPCAHAASFSALAEFPFQATMLDPETALQGLSIRDAKFHAWLGIKMTLGAMGCVAVVWPSAGVRLRG